MTWRHLRGILRQEIFLVAHSLEILVDAFVFPLVNIFIFALISLYLAGNRETDAARYVFLGMLLWQVVAVIAYSVAVGAMWNIWSKNLSNLFLAPLGLAEYVFALFMSGCVKAFVVLALGAALALALFGFSVLAVGACNLSLIFCLFALFGFSLSIVSLGLIFRFGTRLAALSWSIPWIFQPLSAAFFPIHELPRAMQIIAYALPPTYGYEAARRSLDHAGATAGLFSIGFVLASAYLCVAVLAFYRLYRSSLVSGQFARNES